MAAEVLAEVITAAVRAVDEAGVPAAESSETLAEGEGPMDSAEATSGPHSEQPVQVETPCGTASDKGSAEAEAGGEAAAQAADEAADEAAEAGGEVAAEAEGTEVVTAPAPAAAGAKEEQTEAEPEGAVPTD